MKRILDSVHGTILIPAEYCDKIIDTPTFQRLRRIEQNSCRSVFPSARHDRFIHSLGVYHLGSKIAEQIAKQQEKLPDDSDLVLETYKLACLLHDVGHTPFSHTFEEFFDFTAAKKELMTNVDDVAFNNDLAHIKIKPANHEVISSLVAHRLFSPLNLNKSIDWNLLVRMIIGCKYISFNENKESKSFRNVMIELIHGEIIDADRLDYVCRDVWAGGYKSFSIDVDRLISSIIVKCDANGKYDVLYSSKSLNEIETVLNIKNFQNLYVLNHHKVLLEQYCLIESMKSVACYLFDKDTNDECQRLEALRRLCDFRAFYESVRVPKLQHGLFRLMDDDFVSLMKFCPEDSFVSQWFSRKYSLSPIWKSKLEFFNLFHNLLTDLSPQKQIFVCNYIGSEQFQLRLMSQLELNKRQLYVRKVSQRISSLNTQKIKVLINGVISPFEQLHRDSFSVVSENLPFCFLYIDLSQLTKSRNEIIGIIKNIVLDELNHNW